MNFGRKREIDLRRPVDMHEADELSQQLAGELHDGVVQWMVGAKMQAEGLKFQLAQGHSIEPERLDSLIRTLTSGIQEARRLMRGLAGPMIEDGFWCQALRAELLQLVDQVDAGENPSASLRFGFATGVDPLPEKIAETAYRLIREAVWNALRHAKATHIEVQAERDAHELKLVVKDDGRGFDPSAVAPDRLGVRGLGRRAESVGGSAQIESSPSAGTTVTFRLPI